MVLSQHGPLDAALGDACNLSYIHTDYKKTTSAEGACYDNAVQRQCGTLKHSHSLYTCIAFPSSGWTEYAALGSFSVTNDVLISNCMAY